jgi:hypothetical protein
VALLDPTNLLAVLPSTLLDALFASYREIMRNYAERRWEPAELNGGKFCEAVYTILLGYIDGSFAIKPSKPRDMVAACRELERRPPSSSRVGDRSVRILIPRVLLPLYEIRNNRGVGHVGGDVDPNMLDATSVLNMASWVLAELIRVFHGVSTAEAQRSVNALVERKHPLVWQIEDVKRVLDPDMRKEDQTLILLYSEPTWVEEASVMSWVQYSSLPMFRRRILQPLHNAKLIEYDVKLRRACINPRGAKLVEDELLK